MRLWSLHPKHLDAKGLVALWREGLLALAVLRGRTKGYTRHPQLERFRSHQYPIAALQLFLLEVHREATRRGYHFDVKRLGNKKFDAGLVSPIPVTAGQLEFEACHLLSKLQHRAPALAVDFNLSKVSPHPLFVVISGRIESWEKAEGRL